MNKLTNEARQVYMRLLWTNTLFLCVIAVIGCLLMGLVLFTVIRAI